MGITNMESHLAFKDQIFAFLLGEYFLVLECLVNKRCI